MAHCSQRYHGEEQAACGTRGRPSGLADRASSLRRARQFRRPIRHSLVMRSMLNKQWVLGARASVLAVGRTANDEPDADHGARSIGKADPGHFARVRRDCVPLPARARRPRGGIHRLEGSGVGASRFEVLSVDGAARMVDQHDATQHPSRPSIEPPSVLAPRRSAARPAWPVARTGRLGHRSSTGRTEKTGCRAGPTAKVGIERSKAGRRRMGPVACDCRCPTGPGSRAATPRWT